VSVPACIPRERHALRNSGFGAYLLAFFGADMLTS
jgi:hypothetical protein